MSQDNAAEELSEPQETDEPSEQSAEPESSSPDSHEESAPRSQDEQSQSRAEKRINQLVARMSHAEQRAARAEEELEALRKQSETPEPTPEPPAKPKLSDFDGDAKAFAEAVAEWTDERIAFADQQREAAEEKKRKQAEERQQQEQMSAKQRQTLEWLQKGSEDIEDFFDVVTQAPVCSQAMLEVAESMDNGHKVLYDLVQDEAEAARIAKLDGHKAAIEMTKRVQPKSGKSSQAPEPPNPASGSGDKPDRGDLRDDLSTDEWARRFRKRRAKRRQG